MTQTRRRCFVVLIALALHVPASQADQRSQEILDGFEISAKEIARLDDGEILSYSDEEFEFTKRELAADALIRVDAGMDSILEALQDDPTLIPRDLVITAQVIEATSDFDAVGFSAADMDEVEKLFSAKPGKTLNFSNDEFALIEKRLGPHRNASAAEKVDAASAVMREILLARYNAYRENGLAGVAGYDRSTRKRVDVGAELKLTNDAAKVFEDQFPEFVKVMVAYPEGAECCEHIFRWFKAKIRKRPVFALSHTVLRVQDDIVMIMERVYYSSSQLNSLQINTTWVPFEDGGYLGLTTSASADILDSALGRMLRPIGRNKAIDIVEGVMEETKADLEAAPSDE